MNTVYPEASQVFAFSPLQLRDVVKEALFVLDTNALLVPYGTDAASLAAIRTTFTNLLAENKLVVPAQVAREFAKNRPERLKIVYDQLANRRSLNVSPAVYPLLEEQPEYMAMKKVEEELSAKVKEYRETIRGVLTRIRSWYWDDPVSAMYRNMFTAAVVVDVSAKEEELRREMAFRQLHKVPPEYKDASKEIGW